MPFGGTVTIDDVESGQTSAAFAGRPARRLRHPVAGRDFAEATRRVAGEGGRQAGDRHGLPHAITDLVNGGTLEELATLPEQGDHVVQALHGVQGALMVDDRDALRSMQVAAQSGAL